MIPWPMAQSRPSTAVVMVPVDSPRWFNRVMQRFDAGLGRRERTPAPSFRDAAASHSPAADAADHYGGGQGGPDRALVERAPSGGVNACGDGPPGDGPVGPCGSAGAGIGLSGPGGGLAAGTPGALSSRPETIRCDVCVLYNRN